MARTSAWFSVTPGRIGYSVSFGSSRYLVSSLVSWRLTRAGAERLGRRLIRRAEREAAWQDATQTYTASDIGGSNG